MSAQVAADTSCTLDVNLIIYRVENRQYRVQIPHLVHPSGV